LGEGLCAGLLFLDRRAGRRDLDVVAAVRAGAPCCRTREKEEGASNSRGGKPAGRKMKREALEKFLGAIHGSCCSLRWTGSEGSSACAARDGRLEQRDTRPWSRGTGSSAMARTEKGEGDVLLLGTGKGKLQGVAPMVASPTAPGRRWEQRAWAPWLGA
jgi:hypothetical protein